MGLFCLRAAIDPLGHLPERKVFNYRFFFLEKTELPAPTTEKTGHANVITSAPAVVQTDHES